MKKMLFIGNITNRITNVAIPSIEAAQKLGYEFHMAANFNGFVDDASIYDVKLHHIDLVRNPLSIKNLRAVKQMLALIEKEQYDVIHCNTPIGGMLGRICGRLKKIPKIIYTAHGFHFYNGAPLVNRVLFKWAESTMSKLTDAIITMNKEDFDAARKFKLNNNGRVYYVPGVGINTNNYRFENLNKASIRASLGLKSDDFVVIGIGDLIHRKNFETSIKAIANINSQKYHLIICGTGPKLDELKTLTKNLGVEERVHFLGFRTDVKELLGVSNVFLFSTFQEGLPRSLMEAMATGLPCIVSSVRGNVDLVKEGKGGYLIEPYDIKGFSKSLERIANDDHLQNYMKEYNLNAVKKYDIKHVKTAIEKIYDELLNKE
ncbi:glycosyltransferase family 4 protein [Guptibacillus hwajinpoensis]|uniref:glycosyltransferase family 4 protein n=1 Tax=Guptibacillus hwajinpoensis TaxID=208199 RepID=UPI0024B3C266|nr:glycosyltransferase family 4 protein [Pseudalkalibacillus hwajinpoensis]